MKPIVYLTRRIPESGMELLRSHCTLRMHEHDRQITKEELLRGVADADGLLCLLSDPVDAEVIRAGTRLRCISNYAVGYNNIDVEAARAAGIAVTNTPGVLTEATADIAFALMLACARRIVESDAWLREGKFRGWEPMLFLGHDLDGATLGIIGAGRIGQALARKAVGAYGMRLLYHNRKRDANFEQQLGAQFSDLDTVLREADVLSLHLPLTPETHHLIGKRELGLMKRSAILINTARGPVVDEQALIRALREERIFAAGLDVYEEEPSIPDALIALPNTVLLPHIGSASVRTRQRMAEIAARNLLAVLNGGEPEFRVV